jgi:hypothetical protein
VNVVESLLRRLRVGEPLVVVSGLPRSGTSMAMKMLEAGGLSILTDSIRTADDSNPKGYYEFEPVKELDKKGDLAWLPGARGKAVKIISFLLTYLPDSYDYRVIFMHRDLDEVIASQNKMLIERGERPDTTADDRMKDIYLEHLKKVERFLSNRRCFTCLPVHYRDVVEQPAAQARRIDEFLGRRLDVDRMAMVADRDLYRNRGRATRSA